MGRDSLRSYAKSAVHIFTKKLRHNLCPNLRLKYYVSSILSGIHSEKSTDRPYLIVRVFKVNLREN